MAALFTLFIECAQLVTGYGIFELDDLFNNLVGSIIGYGIIMGLLTMKAKKIKHSFLYFSPLLLTGIVFGSMFFYYHVKEFGNLSIRPIHKTDMTEAAKTVEIKLNDKRFSVPIYKAPSFTKKEADEFVVDFFKRINVDPSNMEDISYPDLGVYRVYGENSYNLSFEFLDGSYDFLDFSSHNGDVEPKDVDKEAVQQQLTVFGVEIPEDSSFKKLDTGVFEWTVDKKEIQNQLIDGLLVAKYYSDDTVKGIDNQLVTYKKVRDVQIKSEQEAYEDIVNGKFNYYYDNKKIGNITIHKVEVSYYLDSKGYYQPVYAFYSTVDGTEMTILIPGI
ncbi:hypothetical protein NCCP2222_04280 [Sporosarcina sp. NCCP-2222]|nr:hypothetical protein NCCP2222_04280 [Sporosarcina sp. NCCP-2222]